MDTCTRGFEGLEAVRCGLSVLPGRHQHPVPRPVGPASPCAWSVCVTRKAPLVASDSSEDKTAGALEAVSMGPSREAPPLPTSAPRCAEWGVRRAPGAHGRLQPPGKDAVGTPTPLSGAGAQVFYGDEHMTPLPPPGVLGLGLPKVGPQPTQQDGVSTAAGPRSPDGALPVPPHPPHAPGELRALGMALRRPTSPGGAVGGGPRGAGQGL